LQPKKNNYKIKRKVNKMKKTKRKEKIKYAINVAALKINSGQNELKDVVSEGSKFRKKGALISR
jgi:hypothetical protein